MNDWYNFLQNQGAQLQDGVVQLFNRENSEASVRPTHTHLFDLGHLGALHVVGDGAHQLLQGQTTCDFKELDGEHSLIGAQCNPQGRAIATFRACKTTEGAITLLLPADQLSAVEESLGKYTPFFKVTIKKAGASVRMFGLAGPQARQQLSGCETLAPNGVCRQGSQTVICLSSDRFILLVPDQTAQSVWTELALQASPTGTPTWTLLDIRDGIGDVVAATREMFIPQMINLQSLGGVSFKKGCYTGQEVVARMHYLGKTKRRMYRLQASGSSVPAPGTPCYTDGKQQSAGNIVAATRSDDHTPDNPKIELLAVLTEDATSTSLLKFGETEPVAVKFLTLPYSVEFP